MGFDRFLAILGLLMSVVDLFLLAWIVRQGELLLQLERDNNLMNRERYDERKKWREAKRKKSDTSATNDTSALTSLEKDSMTLSSPNKMDAVESAGDPPSTSPSA